MNKKRLLSITLVAALTVSSTAIIAYASQSSDSSTKNVVKVATDKDQTTSKDSTTKSVSLTIDTSTGEIYELQQMENGKKLIDGIKSGKVVRVKPESNNISSSATENNSNSNNKLLDISDEQAVQTAKDAIKYYTGLDVEKVINRDGLKPYITRSNMSYAWGPNILVTFNSNSNTQDNIFASISATDGKVYNVTAMIGKYSETKVNADKVKEAAASFLKEKGFGGSFTSITVDNEKTPIGIVGAKALYEDGTEILIEFKAEDYSVINFTHRNLKTMKFAH